MENEIIINIRHESHKADMPTNDKEDLKTLVRDILKPVKDKILSFNGHVDAIETNSGNFKFEPYCDDEETENTMRELLSNAINLKH